MKRLPFMGVLIGTALAAVALASCTDPKPEPSDLAPPPIPRVQISTLEELPTPLPLPYDDKATPAEVTAAIDAAFDRARATNKRVIVDLGGNWCSWCRSLAGVMALPEVKPFLDANFEIVHVDVGIEKGEMDRRPEVLKRFGLEKIDGTPWLVVAEPDGTVIHSSYEVTDDDHQTPPKMVEWLAKWVRPAATTNKGAV